MTSAENFAPAVEGQAAGTFFPAHHGRRRSRLVWLRFATRGAGIVRIDEGAAQALGRRHRSLLAVGITAVEGTFPAGRSEEHTSELQSRGHLVCRLLLEKQNHSTTPS